MPTIQSPWAILLCKFKDSDSEPFPRQFYEDLFTASGIGTQNMVDFFSDVSHGTLDLSGTRVFGWYTLDQDRSAYMGSGANQAGRNQLVDWARQAATTDGVNLGDYVGVVVCMNVPTDLFGGGGRVVCDNLSMQPSLLGQEMGHGYGLDHSRADGSMEDYQDPWDVMSTANAYEAPHPTYTFIGPSLNAWNMAGRDWLDESRVWNPSGDAFDAIVQLRPLIRRDLPGLLAARIGRYLVEFRVKEGWDAAIPEPAVLVHRFDDNQSYIMASTGGGFALGEGGVFEDGRTELPFWPWMRVEVLDIDADARQATLQLVGRPRTERPPEQGPATILGGVAEGGGGIAILPGGQVVHIPPREPVLQILMQVAAIQATHLIANPTSREVVQREALSEIIDQAEAQLTSLNRRVQGVAPRNATR